MKATAFVYDEQFPGYWLGDMEGFDPDDIGWMPWYRGGPVLPLNRIIDIEGEVSRGTTMVTVNPTRVCFVPVVQFHSYDRTHWLHHANERPRKP